MDPCAQLRRDLQDALAERDRELGEAKRRFWLALLGLDFVLDWEERGGVDRALSGFLCMVQTGEVVLGLQELFRILRALAGAAGRTSAERLLGRLAGRVVGMAALGLLLVDMVSGYVRWEEEEARIRRRFHVRLQELRETAGCPDADAVFAEAGAAQP
ncbi:MAG: hypothetical protein RQ751_09715 [Longimicrobiales bacterium]|nr:hypothetical protein [Longimicrobiales bacterium]